MENKVIEEYISFGEKTISELNNKELSEAFNYRMGGIRRYRKKPNEKQLYKQYMVMGKLFIHYPELHNAGEQIIYLSRTYLNKLEAQEKEV